MMAGVSLIVMERGSEWPGHVGNVGDLVAVGEDDERLVSRTREGIAALRHRGQHVRVAFLACNGATDPQSSSRRFDIVTELLEAVNLARFGRLVLSTTENASLPVRSELLSLASSLGLRLGGTSVSVSVRFGCAPSVDEDSRPSLRKGLVDPTGLVQRLRRRG
jgi:hypothetical protein